MRVTRMVVILALCFAAVGVCSAQDAFTGTWKLDESKSKIPAGAQKLQTVVYANEGDKVKVTADGIDAAGKPTHSEWTGKFDGKDYPVTGGGEDVRSYRKVDARTLAFTGKKDGKVNFTGRVVIAADGKTRHTTITSIDADGKKHTANAVYEKQ